MRLRILAPIVAAAFAGCSALQIDVDVYKGPLTNDDAIQVRQYAAMALAAKPVLAMLRNDLEQREPGRGDLKLGDAFVDNHKFASSAAEYVNGVLFAFEDRSDGELGRAVRAQVKLEAAIALFMRDGKQRAAKLDLPIAESIDARLPGLTDAAVRKFACEYRRFIDNAPDDAVRQLCNFEQQDPQAANRRWVGQLGAACNTLRERSPKLQCPDGTTSTAAFNTLQFPGVVSQHARLIFGDTDSRAFVARVNEVAKAFLDARAATREIWLAAVQLLDDAPPADRQRLAEIAAVIGDTTQMRNLACAKEVIAPSFEKEAHFLSSFTPGRTATILDPVYDDGWRDEGLGERAQLELRKRIVDRPHDMAALLRLADSGYRNKPAEKFLNVTCVLTKWRDQENRFSLDARRFGLVAGLELDDSLSGNLQALRGRLGRLVPINTHSWDRGRGDKGLETLYSELLTALGEARNDMGDPDVVKRVDALTEALIPFAERLLYVVNNGRLFPEYETDRTERTILQTLGNTLTLHANDLRRRTVHAERQARAFQPELAAVQTAFGSRSFEAAFEELRQHVQTVASALADVASNQAERIAQAQQNEQQAQAKLKTEDAAVSSAKAARDAWPKPPARVALAYQTLVEPRPLKLGVEHPLADDEAARAAQDRNAMWMRIQVQQPGYPVTGSQVQRLILDWIDAELGTAPSVRKLPRQLRLRATADHLRSGELRLGDIPPDAAPVVATAIVERLQRQVDDLAAYAQGLDAAITAADVRQQGAKAQVDAAAKQVKSAKEASADAAAAKVGVGLLLAVREAVLVDARKGAGVGSEGVRSRVVAELRLQTKAKPDTEAAARWTIAEVGKVTLAPLSPTFPHERGAYAGSVGSKGALGQQPTQLQVLEDMIALLRARRIEALAQGDQKKAEQLLVAIDNAYDQRASMVFLRPAADYLKNVYSATALQNETTPTERNMLWDWIRTLTPTDKQRPGDASYSVRGSQSRLGAEGEQPGAGVRRSAEIDITQARRELEKLFWQNINRVALSGGVSSNYAVIKDDVGNWSIKSYSNDPRALFESAKGLALLNRGAKLNMNLLRRAELRQRADDPKLPTDERKLARDEISAGSAGPSTPELAFAQRTRDRFTRSYLAETQSDAAEIEGRTGGLLDALKQNWSRDFSEGDADQKAVLGLLVTRAGALYTVTVDPPRKDLAAAREAGTAAKGGDVDKSAADIGRRIVALADAVRRWRQQFSDEADAQAVPAVLTDKRDKARNAALQQTRAIVEDSAARRRRTIDAYLDSLTTLGDAISGP